MSTREGKLPKGLTHPYESRVRAAVYRQGHTFSWVPGDEWIAVQRGRVANASQRLLVLRDQHPGEQMLLGRHAVIGVVKAPPTDSWYDPKILEVIADRWVDAKTRTMASPCAGER